MHQRLFSGLTCVCALLAFCGTARANQLLNPSFEDGFNNWSTFNNAFPTSDVARTGNSSALILGPFFNLPNSSGFIQDVPAAPGDTYRGSIFLINDSSILTDQGQPDIIAGTQNKVRVLLEWTDGNGNVLALGDESVVFDGQDSGLILDQFVEGVVVAGPAPAGTGGARLAVLFDQVDFEGGLVFADDASLARIPEPATAGLLALGLMALTGRGRR